MTAADPLDPVARLVFCCVMFRLGPLLLALALSACAPPAVLRAPVVGASYNPVQAEFPPLPAVMERTGDAPIALPEPARFTPIGGPRWDQGARP